MVEKNTKNIIDLIKKGDRKVLQKIYNENREIFLKFSKKYNIEEYDALDIYQDAILIFYENIVGGKIVDLSSKISTYIFAIGKYKIFQLHRDSGKKQSNNEIYVDEENIYLDVNLDDDKLTNQQELLYKYFPRLGNRCKEILKLFYYEGYTLDEITDILNYSDKKVLKSQKSRCLKQLKDWIKKES